MNIQTLKKLQNNPFYKLSKKQELELRTLDKKPMIEFGVPNIHSSSLDKHPVSMLKIGRYDKKNKQK